MQKIRELCDKYGIVMIADEIQSGSGRTGRLFAIEHTGVVPDVMTIAKSLGAGMPVSAVVGRAEIMDCTHLGGVGGTYGGSPVAAVAAIEALKILSSGEFLDRATHVGTLIKSTLDTWKEKFAMVGDVRATGAMCIVEFVKHKSSKEPDMELPLEVLKDAVAHGIILIRAGLYSNCIRLLPPIVMTDEQLHEGLKVLEDAIARAHAKRSQ
jgi:4-aminobutyrate aminotransferase/(S)-3-amino-2-methylpropionate transaminase